MQSLKTSGEGMDQFVAEELEDYRMWMDQQQNAGKGDGKLQYCECACPVPPFVMIGEAPDDYCQMITLSLRDGLFYHTTGNIPEHVKVGNAFDFLSRYGTRS